MGDTPDLTQTDFTDSYSESGRGKGGSKKKAEANPLVDQMSFGFDPETLDYISQQTATPTIEDNLSAQSFYPMGNEGIDVGQYSGPKGSFSLMSEGAPEIPYELIYAKQRQRDAQAEAERKGQQLQLNYYRVKDKARSKVLEDDQVNFWEGMKNQYFAQYKEDGVPAAAWADKFMTEPDVKKGLIAYRNGSENWNDYWDKSMKVVTDMTSPQNMKDGGYTDYHSPETFVLAKNFLDGAGGGTMGTDDMLKLNPNEFTAAESLDKMVDEYWSNPKQAEIVNQMIAKAGSALGTKGVTNTNSNQVYEYIKTTGYGEDFLTNAAVNEYKGKYGSLLRAYNSTVEETTGKDGKKHYKVVGGAANVLPDIEKDVIPRFMSRLKEGVERSITNVGQDLLGEKRLAFDKEKEKYQDVKATITTTIAPHIIDGKVVDNASVEGWNIQGRNIQVAANANTLTGLVWDKDGNMVDKSQLGANNYLVKSLNRSTDAKDGKSALSVEIVPMRSVNVYDNYGNLKGTQLKPDFDNVYYTDANEFLSPIVSTYGKHGSNKLYDTQDNVVPIDDFVSAAGTAPQTGAAGAQPQNKPAPNGQNTVTQNGYTYTWNPVSGQYE